MTTLIGHGEKLSRAKEKAIGALLTCPTIPEAAQAAGVSPRTLRRWIKLPSFNSAIAEARRMVVSNTIGRLQSAMDLALDALIDVISDHEAPVGSKVTSARVILEMGLRATELMDFAERISAIEEQINRRHIQ